MGICIIFICKYYKYLMNVLEEVYIIVNIIFSKIYKEYEKLYWL